MTFRSSYAIQSQDEFLLFLGLVISYGTILQAKANISATQHLPFFYLSVACSFKVAKNWTHTLFEQAEKLLCAKKEVINLKVFYMGNKLGSRGADSLQSIL